MHRDPKREAQIAEDVGLTAQPQEAVSVANPDSILGATLDQEKGIEAARLLEQQKKIAEDKEKKLEEELPNVAKPAPATSKPNLSNQDKLDRERAMGEGMTPPPSSP